jgi:hypothetical protein
MTRRVLLTAVAALAAGFGSMAAPTHAAAMKADACCCGDECNCEECGCCDTCKDGQCTDCSDCSCDGCDCCDKS